MRFLSNYLDFIFESVAKKEMRLYYSDEFRNMLRRVNNSISQALLGAEDSNQITDIYTLVDITEKNDTISLIQINRITRGNTELDETLPDSIRDKKRGSDFWNKGRTEMKIGRWVKRLFTEVHKSTITDSDIEKFVNKYKSSFDADNNRFEVVKGEDIRKWYLELNYETSKGQLGNSCMRYMSCQSFFDIYTKNPEVCSLLIMKSDDYPNKIVGRSILWLLDDGTKYQDRIYTIKDSDKELFNQWADKNGYSTHDSSYKTMKVQLGNHEYSKYPYMDTFVCYNPYTKVLISSEDYWPGQGYYLLQSTSGGYKEDDVIYSEWHGEYIQRSEAVFCENVHDWLHRDEAKYLEYKDIWVAPNGDVTYSEYEGEYFLTDDCVYSDLMQDWLYRENDSVIEIITNKNGDTDWCVKSKVELYIKVGDDYYSRRDCVKDPFTGELKFKTSDYERELDEKLMVDFGIERNDNTLDRKGSPVTKVIDDVREDLKERLLKLEITDDIKKAIEENTIYKKEVINVYWGLSKDNKPTEEDMFAIIKSFMINKTISGYNSQSYYYSLMNKYVFFRSKEVNKNENKFKIFNSAGILRPMVKVCLSFDYSLFPEDIYKRYLFTTI